MKALILAVAAAAAFSVQAQPKPDVFNNGNMWSITFYDDSSPNHDQWATQNICFVPTGMTGTQLAGYWYSTTFFDWNGTFRQEGDQVFMTGDYAGDSSGNAVGHDGIDFQLTTMERKSEGFGHWREWRENGSMGQVIGYGNTKLVRIGSCPTQPPVGADALTLEKFAFSNSQQAPRRYRTDGKEALGPMDRYLAPLQ